MAVRPINASRFAEILEQWKKDCLQDNDQQSADVISDVILQLDDMPTLTPPNEPLTIEQLREMDGEAVYIMPMKWWALVDSPKGLKRVILRLKGGGWAAFYSDEDLKNYVEAVYRRPPEGEDK